jgi:hypothetical protein
MTGGAPTDPDIKHLSADDLFWERVEAARRQSPEDKLLAGPRLFARACRIIMDGIRWQFPDASEDEVQRILRERLDIARRLETRS